MLKHLILLPSGGLGNRMRAIASAKRLCQMCGARCSVVWDWQDYEALFERDPEVEAIAELPSAAGQGYSNMRTLLNTEGGSPDTRRIPLDGPAGIVLDSCHCFGATSDEGPMDESSLLAWPPRPAKAVSDRVEAFRSQAFANSPVVGLHVRRTDNRAAARRSPDRVFMRAADAIRRDGAALFLATDNRKTEARMRRRFGDGLILYPKNPAVERRWPKPFNLAEITADYVDLLLLAACDHVLGSWGSSYSRLAIALNGSPRSRILLSRWRLPTWL